MCQYLMRIGFRLYGPTLSDRIHRLPFGLYLRVSAADWGPRHQAEFHTLGLIEKHTTVPAPRPVDVFQYQARSYLLMTRVPGRPIGTFVARLTDEQLQGTTEQLRKYVTEIRQIPNTTNTGFQICNSLGAGILDWRIGDSQRRELRFTSAIDFHKCLTSGYSQDLQQQAAPSHTKDHKIVFTHADLNLRNILADEIGKVTGIVDWECAGWYPEYWEYTKSHFGVRFTLRWVADVIDEIFPGYEEELRVENMLVAYAPFL